MNKLWSVLLFLLGLAFFAGGFINFSVRSAAGMKPEAAAIVTTIVIGGLCIWGGVKLWRRKAG